MNELTDEKLDQLALVFALEQQIRELPIQIDLETITDHDFCDGLYARSMRLPAFVALTGAIHKHENFFVVRIGTMLITDGESVRQIGPGDMFVTQAGTKRAGFTLTDCVITTIHPNPTNEQEPAKLWDLYAVDPPQALLDYLEIKRLQS